MYKSLPIAWYYIYSQGGVMYAELKFLKAHTGIKRPPIPPTKYSEIQDFEEITNHSSDISP